MNQRTYQATVIDGSIELPPNVKLPENAKVLVTVPEHVEVPRNHVRSPQLVDPRQIGDFRMEVERAPDAGV